MAGVGPITEYYLTDHARVQMVRRQIGEAEVAEVLARPEEIAAVREARFVYQSRVTRQDPVSTYLLRVFVDVDRTPPEVGTIYRTGKIKKYLRAGS